MAEKCHERPCAGAATRLLVDHFGGREGSAGDPNPVIVLTVLPLAPRRGRESQLACRRLIGPDHHLFAILPLERDRLVADLEATLIPAPPSSVMGPPDLARQPDRRNL
jgi:hypothetical protein